MANILVPMQEGQDVTWLVNHLQKIHQREAVRVHLLSVQPRYTSLVRLFFTVRDLNSFKDEDANLSLAPMRRALDLTNITYNCHVRTGDKATEIVKFAKELFCPQIILGPTTGNWIFDLLFGSLTTRVESMIRLADSRCKVL
ncbi:USP_Like domain containing protein [Burkholderiaceae bacterium]